MRVRALGEVGEVRKDLPLFFTQQRTHTMEYGFLFFILGMQSEILYVLKKERSNAVFSIVFYSLAILFYSVFAINWILE